MPSAIDYYDTSGRRVSDRNVIENARTLISNLNNTRLPMDRGEIIKPSLPTIEQAININPSPQETPAIPGRRTTTSDLQYLETDATGGTSFEQATSEDRAETNKWKSAVSPEVAMQENLDLLGPERVAQLNLNDPYIVNKLQNRGLVQITGPTLFMKNFTEPNKENFVTKAGKAFLGPAAGAVLGAATFGAASPLIAGIGGGAVSGAVGSTTGQAIRGGGLEAIDFGDVGKSALVGGVAGGAGSLTSGISNPVLKAAADSTVHASLGQLAEGEFDLGDLARSAAVGTGLTVAGGAIQGASEAYNNPNETMLHGAMRGGFTGGDTPEYVSDNVRDFNDLDAEAFGPLSSNFDLAGTEGYNPSEDVYQSQADATQSEFEAINAELNQPFEQKIAMMPWGTSAIDRTGMDSARLTQLTSGNIEDVVDPRTLMDARGAGTFFPSTAGGFSTGDASIQSDFEGINSELETSDANLSEDTGAIDSAIGDGKLVGDLSSIAINSLLSGLIPDAPTSAVGGTISSGLIQSILGIGSGKSDDRSDLQVRGLGI